MIIQELVLKAFGKFHNKTIGLQQDMNVIEGQNEAGKSTIHTFIGAVLFGLDKDDSVYKKYKPWIDLGGAYGGAIKFEEAGKVYILERRFTEGTVELTQIGTGITLRGAEAESELSQILGGLTKIGYVNTVSIEQMKGTTDETIAQELKDNLDNLSRARSTSLNFRDAESALKKLRDDINYKLADPGESRIKELEEKLAEAEKQYAEVLDIAWNARNDLEKAAELKKEAYDSYENHREELINRREKIEHEQSEITSQQEEWKKIDDKVKLLLRQKRVQMEILKSKGKDMVKAFAPNLMPIWFMAICFMLIGGISIGYYFLQDHRRRYIFGGAGIAAVGLIMIIVAVVRLAQFNKRKAYYRSIIERQSRQIEYIALQKKLDEERNLVFQEMSEEQTGDYMKACEFYDNTEKLMQQINSQTVKMISEMDKLKSQYYMAIEDKKAYENNSRELDAVNLAWEHLYRASDISVKTFGRDLIQLAGGLINVITEGKYTAITRNEDGVVCLISNDVASEISTVSRGTMEQVYLCIRLAATTLLSPKVVLPIILDDTFAYYDDERTRQALILLKSCGHQVILFTCHSREKKMLNKM